MSNMVVRDQVARTKREERALALAEVTAQDVRARPGDMYGLTQKGGMPLMRRGAN